MNYQQGIRKSSTSERLARAINRLDELSEQTLAARDAVMGCGVELEFWSGSAAAARELSHSAGILHALLEQRAGSEAAEVLLQLDLEHARTSAGRVHTPRGGARRHPGATKRFSSQKAGQKHPKPQNPKTPLAN